MIVTLGSVRERWAAQPRVHDEDGYVLLPTGDGRNPLVCFGEALTKSARVRFGPDTM
jgi:hypothetical protein